MFAHMFLSFIGKFVSRGKLSILIYHQVLSEYDPLRPAEPTKAIFYWQMKLVRKYFTPISLTEALKCLENDTLPHNAICVTFDDGYINNLDLAAPILEELNIPATIFIATSFMSGLNMWNDRIIDLVANHAQPKLKLTAIDEESITLINQLQQQQLVKRLIDKIKYLQPNERDKIIDQLYVDNKAIESPRKMVSVAQIQALDAFSCIDIGGHTLDHPILKTLDKSEQLIQIQENKDLIESILSRKIVGFAYPNGKAGIDFDNVTKNLVMGQKFLYSLSTDVGVSTKYTDRYELKRFTPWDKKPLKYHLRLMLNNLVSNKHV